MSEENLRKTFPKLAPAGYGVTSEETVEYNCIAWAAGDSARWWWPVKEYYWPSEAPLEETLDAFAVAYRTLGYAACPDGTLEAGFEKVALYADATGTPTHAARQLENGRWSSKLGELEDIEHTLEGLEGAAYGVPRLFMKRRRT